jgi:hypothetical protein
MTIYGSLQPITGAELATVYQMQNGQMVTCSMPLSDLIQVITLTALAAGLPTTEPTTAGIVWNNGGVLSITN